ncbi:hypothetical protein ABT224_10650 [Streptomyces sp. NPDC001584]
MSCSLTTADRRLRLREFGCLPQWSRPWAELHPALEGRVVVALAPGR